MTSTVRALQTPTMIMSAARAIVGILVIAILFCTYALGVPAGRDNLFDYFGYFTNLTSLLTASLLITTGATALSRRTVAGWLHLAHGAAVSSMIVVALVYNLIVPGTGTAPVWASVILHIVFPVLLVLDWLLIADRPPLPWGRIWVVLPYPLLWLAVTLVRGVTDGWVPYGFLLPSRGSASLIGTTALLLVALLAAALIVWTISRLRRGAQSEAQALRHP